VTHLAALSDGTFIDHPRFFRKAEKKLKKLQTGALKEKERLSSSKKSCQTSRQMSSHAQKSTSRLSPQAISSIGRSASGDGAGRFTDRQSGQSPKTETRLRNRAIPSQWGKSESWLKSKYFGCWMASFVNLITFKAVWAGRTVIFVNPYKTSQICHRCGAEGHKGLSDRWHSCACGEELDRDTNSAKLILKLGQRLLGGKRPRPKRRRSPCVYAWGTSRVPNPYHLSSKERRGWIKRNSKREITSGNTKMRSGLARIATARKPTQLQKWSPAYARCGLLIERLQTRLIPAAKTLAHTVVL